MSILFSNESETIKFFHRVSEHPLREKFPMHAHDSFEIYYFISGNCKYMVEGNEYPLKHGDIMIMRPSETHNLCVIGDERYERITINIASDFFRTLENGEKLSEPFFNRNLGVFNHYQSEAFPTGFQAVCFENIADDPAVPSRVEIEAKTVTALCEICRCFRQKKREESEETAPTDTTAMLIAYINAHLFEPLSLADLSERFYLSQSQINRVFRRSTGSSVWEYITIKRLIAARDQIRAGTPAGMASCNCGFGDYSSFYRLYKARFGVSPKQNL